MKCYRLNLRHEVTKISSGIQTAFNPVLQSFVNYLLGMYQ